MAGSAPAALPRLLAGWPLACCAGAGRGCVVLLVVVVARFVLEGAKQRAPLARP